MWPSVVGVFSDTYIFYQLIKKCLKYFNKEAQKEKKTILKSFKFSFNSRIKVYIKSFDSILGISNRNKRLH